MVLAVYEILSCRNQALAQACVFYSPSLRVDECNGDFATIIDSDVI